MHLPTQQPPKTQFLKSTRIENQLPQVVFKLAAGGYFGDEEGFEPDKKEYSVRVSSPFAVVLRVPKKKVFLNASYDKEMFDGLHLASSNKIKLMKSRRAHLDRFKNKLKEQRALNCRDLSSKSAINMAENSVECIKERLLQNYGQRHLNKLVSDAWAQGKPGKAYIPFLKKSPSEKMEALDKIINDCQELDQESTNSRIRSLAKRANKASCSELDSSSQTKLDHSSLASISSKLFKGQHKHLIKINPPNNIPSETVSRSLSSVRRGSNNLESSRIPKKIFSCQDFGAIEFQKQLEQNKGRLSLKISKNNSSTTPLTESSLTLSKPNRVPEAPSVPVASKLPLIITSFPCKPVISTLPKSTSRPLQKQNQSQSQNQSSNSTSINPTPKSLSPLIIGPNRGSKSKPNLKNPFKKASSLINKENRPPKRA